MPQIAKGGKYIFGWSSIRPDGITLISPEAMKEYGMSSGENVILISGSKTSGGFSICSISALKKSVISKTLMPDLESFRNEIVAKEIIWHGKRAISQVLIRDNMISLSPTILKAYNISRGNCLLSVRGSNLGIGMISRGPIFELAKQHTEINTFY